MAMKRGNPIDVSFKSVDILDNVTDSFTGLGTNDAGETSLFELKIVKNSLYFIVGGFTRSYAVTSDFFKGFPVLVHALHEKTDTIKLFKADDYYRNTVQKFVHVDEMHRG